MNSRIVHGGLPSSLALLRAGELDRYVRESVAPGDLGGRRANGGGAYSFELGGVGEAQNGETLARVDVAGQVDMTQCIGQPDRITDA